MAGQSFFISGANRGIGFELVKQLAANSENTVIATTRSIERSSELVDLATKSKNIKIVTLDTSSESSFDALEKELTKVIPEGIDVLIANAGIGQGFFSVLEASREVYLNHYNTNVLGSIFLTRILHPYLLKKKTRKIVFISSLAGRIKEMSAAASSAAYGSSKATLNFLAKSLSFELEPEHFIVVPVHPGAVTTDMGHSAIDNGPARLQQFFAKAGITPEFSAKSLITLVDSLTKESSGKFYNYDGAELAY